MFGGIHSIYYYYCLRYYLWSRLLPHDLLDAAEYIRRKILIHVKYWVERKRHFMVRLPFQLPTPNLSIPPHE